MIRLVRTLLAVALLASSASVASAAFKYPPGPPYKTCADSATIWQLVMPDTTVNLCRPYATDTVLGMRGVITGFRPRSTGRVYIQNTNAADYSGVQVYTQSFHAENNGYVIGDSISVLRSLMANYQGETQVQGNTFIKLEKIESKASREGRGLGLPPFRIGSTTTFKWTPVYDSYYPPTINVSPGLASLGSLVRIDDDLRVVRRGPGAGLPGNQNYLCVNYDGSAPGDSVHIDGYTLTPADIIAPPLNTRIKWVQGIMRRAAPSGTDYIVISLRGPGDIEGDAPPNLAEAYPIDENKVRLLFDKDVDKTTAEDEGNYTLGSAGSGSTVDDATLVDGAGAVVDLTFTNVQARLSLESIQTEAIGSQSCPACLSDPQSREFILGVLTCAEVQAPLGDSLGADPCLDKSRFAGAGSAFGTRLTVRGVMSAHHGADYFLQDATGEQRNAVVAYNIPFAVTDGHQYLLATRVQEFSGMTELNNHAALIDEGEVTPPEPSLTTLAVLNDWGCDPNEEITNSEDYEASLVRVENVKIVAWNTPPTAPSKGGPFRVAGPVPLCPDTLLVYPSGNSYPDFTPVVNSWVNINGSHYNSTYYGYSEIYPRNADDIEVLGVLGVTDAPLELAFSVKPNPGLSHSVSFTVPRKDKVEVSVFDLLGRRLAVLAKGEFAAGKYTRNWDGRTTDGAKATAGVYFYRLTVGSEVRTLRAVKLN